MRCFIEINQLKYLEYWDYTIFIIRKTNLIYALYFRLLIIFIGTSKFSIAESFTVQTDQKIGLQYVFKDTNSNDWIRVNKTLNSSNFEDELRDMEAKRPNAVNITLNNNEKMTKAFFSANLDSVENLKISKATITDLNLLANMKSLKSIDLTNNIFNRTQLQMFGNNSIFPNLECITLKQLSLMDKLGLNGRNCGVNKTTLIMNFALKGDCECGKRNDVDGPEVENLEIKQPAQKPPAKLPILDWILITLIISGIICFIVVSVLH
jgi:hypothetical protein